MLEVCATREPGRAFESDGGLTDADRAAFDAAEIQLDAWTEAGEDGGRSFEGRRYIAPVLDITGVSLFTTYIEPGKVKHMYEALTACDIKTVYSAFTGCSGDPETERLNLCKFLEICIDEERALGIETA